MKKLLSPLCIVLLLLTACKTSMPLGHTPYESTLIRVECNDDKIIQNTVYQLLRSTKAKDIQVQKDEMFARITAVYSNKDISIGRVEEIAQQIRTMPGVIQSTIEENKRAVLQVAERAPAQLR
ncbi:MAG: hypothetical protein ABIR18_00105 [Chitinophagaceae bacterium]